MNKAMQMNTTELRIPTGGRQTSWLFTNTQWRSWAQEHSEQLQLTQPWIELENQGSINLVSAALVDKVTGSNI